MIVTSDSRQLPGGQRILVLGNFDGVHLGHQALFRNASRLAAHDHGKVIAMGFHPHPLEVLGFPVDAIIREEEKVQLIAEQGAAAYFVMPFSKAVANMSPQDFIEQVLLRDLAASHVVVGFNFSFGRGGLGTPEFLQRYLGERGVPVTIVPPVMWGGAAVSSTRIRQSIRHGDLEEAANLLGRPVSIRGVVQHGDQRGRTMGFPTANLSNLQGLVLPPFGVYAASVPGIGPGMANLGLRPSFPGEGLGLEMHIFDWQGDLYGQSITVELHRFLRGERRFAALADLQEQLEQDQVIARRLLSSLRLAN